VTLELGRQLLFVGLSSVNVVTVHLEIIPKLLEEQFTKTESQKDLSEFVQVAETEIHLLELL